jgi:hypothetical protein
LTPMAPSASARRRRKRGRGEGEGREEAALGAQSPQQGGAHRQRRNANEPGTHFLFSLV